ncbi:Bax inhibitor-1/YccA family protein [Helcobacillus sp. ACRRO]|uniref:Bax inhibitor-1/YccA family protein n=1 Tax=Helcobacillus sp. ACRRO TaxID=2918202 RepID=UPI001EF43744|nr:Bax inhibitor-1/YccA family protein [Helcobacillus sp. ACRRO]MCG7426142.1 Bax inhibitor-1/YccA family protein [Helcobacillus sp. ACRRO]
MAGKNILFGKDPAFREGGGQYAPAPQYNQAFGQPQQGYGQPQQGSPEQLNQMFMQPAATGHDTGRVSYRDIMNALTATLGTIMLIAAVVMAIPAVVGAVAGEDAEMAVRGLLFIATIIGLIGSLIFGIWGSFKRRGSAPLTMAYAVFEGLLLGGISSTFEMIYPGIVFQAVLATLAVVASILVLFRMGKLRSSPKLTKIFFVALGAYMIFSLVNLALIIFTQTNLRYGDFSWLGLAVGAFAVLLASYSLVLDLEAAQIAVNNGAERSIAWRVALGLALTVVWMYMEILRLLSILRD